MVENTVVKEQLTDAMVDAGAELTKKLEETGLPLSAALWNFDPEANKWRMVFASPDVATRGPLAVYTKIQQAVIDLKEKASAAPFSAIRLLDGDAELVKVLRQGVQTGPGLSRIRLSRSAIRGRYIDDALIYHVA